MKLADIKGKWKRGERRVGSSPKEMNQKYPGSWNNPTYAQPARVEPFAEGREVIYWK